MPPDRTSARRTEPVSHARRPSQVSPVFVPLFPRPRFVQGDAIANPPLMYFGDPALPVWARTAAYLEDSQGPEVIEAGEQTQPRFGIITTQTCDVAEEDANWPIKPWVQVSPAYNRSDLDGGTRKLLLGNRGPRHLIHLPALPVDGSWVADLRIEVPVEKGWLASQERVPAFEDEAAQRAVGDRLALLRRRPAFGRRFVEGIQRPLVMRLRELRKESRDVYNRMRSASGRGLRRAR